MLDVAVNSVSSHAVVSGTHGERTMKNRTNPIQYVNASVLARSTNALMKHAKSKYKKFIYTWSIRAHHTQIQISYLTQSPAEKE